MILVLDPILCGNKIELVMTLSVIFQTYQDVCTKNNETSADLFLYTENLGKVLAALPK